ncbi:nuclear transport factor 2 family protein [Mucilaginibacter pedocola]|uniref:SnoaL-like domain-containing protein n=1 Tax=Mucilaginibacter pedocola TaxID=1792845 RepID=A0A1S9PLJ8_9SPHI|nr:nuclear transport factor 2 family protein [Mucilaginibacter pedocola]OOQ61428.1 hypothetical protein BC343_20905 [Mucilaginibacter pedocola]
MKNMTETITRYISAWNTTTADEIKAAITSCCHPQVTYTDKNTPKFTGIDDLVALILSAHEKFPGIGFSVLTSPEYFEGNCYYTWGMFLPGTGDVAGRDYMVYNEENKIVEIVGFLPAL